MMRDEDIYPEITHGMARFKDALAERDKRTRKHEREFWASAILRASVNVEDETVRTALVNLSDMMLDWDGK